MRRTAAFASPHRRRRPLNRLLRLVQGLTLVALTCLQFQWQPWGQRTAHGFGPKQHVQIAVADAFAVIGRTSLSTVLGVRRTIDHCPHLSNENCCRRQPRTSKHRRNDPDAWSSRPHASFVQLLSSSSSSSQEFEKNNHRVGSPLHHHQHRAESYGPILELLQRHNYQTRLRTIDARSDLPLYAEAYLQGTSELVRIVRFVAEPVFSEAADLGANGAQGSYALKEPKVVVEIIIDDGESVEARSTASTATTLVVDVAQITTVFFPHDVAPTSISGNNSTVRGRGSESSLHKWARDPHELVNDRALERALDQLYGSRVGRGRAVSSTSSSSSSGLSKKQVQTVVQQWFDSSTSSQNPASDGASRHGFTYPSYKETADHAERVLRQTVKIGAGSTRLVDASVLWESVRQDSAGRNRGRINDKRIKSRAIPRGTDAIAPDAKSIQWAGRALANDAQMGGRFKRWPCVVVGCSAVPTRFAMEKDQAPMATAFTSSSADDMTVTSISLLNGGWLAVDQSVRAGAEARKFVERRTSSTPASTQMKVDTDTTGGTAKAEAPPGALERTVRTQADMRIIQRLECLAMGEDLASTTDRLQVDVRETLSAMNLDLSPSGAKQALLQVGWWTRDISSERSRVEPWSSTVLEAASWYVSQQTSLEQVLESFYKTRLVDLTRYPCLCIDAQRTKFRDDALGLRPRADTGRPVIPGASKWEVLVHIVDVGDIYTVHDTKSLSNNDKIRLAQLKDASKSRGTSRYDLPLGPLHLMPPRVLEALSFSKDSPRQRCLTLWAFIDERNGNLLDFGLERTWVRSPVMLSYGKASDLIDTPHPEREIDAKERALLLVLERLLSRWSGARMLNHEASQRRQERHMKRQQDDRDTTGIASLREDDGRYGFTTSRAHRMVDSALELYSTGVSTLIRKSGAPIPQAKGAESFRGGRVATAPLRRYVDGEAQRQALAVLFGQGRQISAKDCAEIGRVANMARNSIANVRSARNS